jgi:transposase
LLLHVIVHPADIQDRDGGILLLATLFGMYPFLKKLFADGGYQGPEFQKALAKILPHLETEIVKRSDHAKGFVVLPRRWVVERTIAWLNRCRRLAKDWENLNRKALTFPKIRDEIFEDAATLGGMGFSAHFGQRDGGWFPVTQFRGRFFAVRAGIFESFRHRYAGGGSSFGFPRARQAPGITTALEWHPLPA